MKTSTLLDPFQTSPKLDANHVKTSTFLNHFLTASNLDAKSCENLNSFGPLSDWSKRVEVFIWFCIQFWTSLKVVQKSKGFHMTLCSVLDHGWKLVEFPCFPHEKHVNKLEKLTHFCGVVLCVCMAVILWMLPKLDYRPLPVYAYG